MPPVLNNQRAHQGSLRALQAVYDQRLIPAEKKPFLVDVRRSSGPFLAIDGGERLLDAASQIASLGLGFNAGALFGTAHWLEAWTNNTHGVHLDALKRALSSLLVRKLGWPAHCHFCLSGAEAVETALGLCFEHYGSPRRKKVLAFQGSFHGRMMVALAATWSPAKREPFAWPGFEAVFVPYPEISGDDVAGDAVPDGWTEVFAGGTRGRFDQQVDRMRGQFSADQQLQRELDCLSEVRHHLQSGEVFAVLVEPMQCEGGERYSSARFHNGLANLARGFGIPLVYDEIQTGYGLGGTFWWHRKFDLRDTEGRRLEPDCVVSAKKAQLGVVLSKLPCDFDQPVCCSSLARGYIQASMMDQFEREILRIEKNVRGNLAKLVTTFQHLIYRPRCSGLSFAFEFKDHQLLKKFVDARFEMGLIYYPAGSGTARFRLNLAFRSDELKLLWTQLERCLASLNGRCAAPPSPPIAPATDAEAYYDYHQELVQAKLDRMRSGKPSELGDVRRLLAAHLASAGLDGETTEIVFLNPDNYPQYRERIRRMQAEVYEPARQTAIEKFDKLAASTNHLGLVVLQSNRIIGLAMAAPLFNFPEERGLTEDPAYNDPQTVYMLDLTVADGFRGKLGRGLKQAILLYAQCKGIGMLVGRNRDRLARGMWAINMSLGSYEDRYLPDDYADDQPFRDCLYYRCPVQWTDDSLRLADAIASPLDASQLSSRYIQRAMPALINKLTLSNFVSRSFLQSLQEMAGLFLPELRHVYTASGLSECVDKIVKVLWKSRPGRTRLLTLQGHYFGSGSFLARSLSGVGQPYFDVVRIPWPGGGNPVEQLRPLLGDDRLLAFFVEPLSMRGMDRLDEAVLRALVLACRQYGVPIVFNDTAGLMYRYAETSFAASGAGDLRPDASISYLGGQMGLVCVSGEWFVADPLMLISTWDGDEYSLAAFHQAVSAVECDRQRYFATMHEYDAALRTRLAAAQCTVRMHRGVGWVAGQIPIDLQHALGRTDGGRWISCPSYGQMKQFLRRAAMQ